jgi:hypothetical protein
MSIHNRPVETTKTSNTTAIIATAIKIAASTLPLLTYAPSVYPDSRRSPSARPRLSQHRRRAFDGLRQLLSGPRILPPLTRARILLRFLPSCCHCMQLTLIKLSRIVHTVTNNCNGSAWRLRHYTGPTLNTTESPTWHRRLNRNLPHAARAAHPKPDPIFAAMRQAYRGP